MDFDSLISFIGATIGAGFFMLFGYAYAFSGPSVFYSLIICFIIFSISAYVFLQVFFNEKKTDLSFLEKKIKFPYQWIILLAEISWLSLCVLSVGIIGNQFLSIPVLNTTIVSLILLAFVNLFRKSQGLERIMVTLVLLSFFMVLVYHVPASEPFFPYLSLDVLPSIPLLFILFVGFERQIFSIPVMGKKDRIKSTFVIAFVALLFYISLFFLFPSPNSTVYFVYNYFPYPFNYAIMIPVSLILLASANTSIDSCVEMIEELSEKKYLPKLFRNRREYPEILIVLVISLILAMTRNILNLAFLANISYITFYLLVSIYAIIDKEYDSKIPIVSALLLSLLYFFIPSTIIFMFLLLIPLMVFSGDIFRAIL